MLKRAEGITVKKTYQGNLIGISAHFLRFLKRTLFGKSSVKSEWSDRF